MIDFFKVELHVRKGPTCRNDQVDSQTRLVGEKFRLDVVITVSDHNEKNGISPPSQSTHTGAFKSAFFSYFRLVKDVFNK
jgi:hypothetical protein